MEMKSLKQFAGWDINLWRRYQNDLFFRTTCHIIALQVFLAGILAAVFWYSLQYLGQNVASKSLDQIQMMLLGSHTTQAEFSATIEDVANTQFYPAATILIAIALCFAFITTYIALTPTRRSLERKRRFINNVAHELRTPLAVIRTNTEVALLEENIPQHIEGVLKDTVEELGRISGIMDNLLTLSSMMRLTEMKFSDIDLHTVVENALETLEHSLKKRNVTVEIQGDTEFVIGNTIALEQVVFNLVKNAANHSDPGSTVVVTIAATPWGHVDVSITDTGSGIAPDDLYYIFEPFYRAQKTPRHPGSGLGLAIVSDIVRAHRGKISVQSALNVGTTVTVSLPCAVKDVPPEKTQHEIDHPEIKKVSVDYSKSLFHD